MKRTAAVVGALGLTIALGAGVATAETVAEPTPEPTAEVSTGSMVIETIERAATAEDAENAVLVAAGEMTVEGLRECGLGALVGTTNLTGLEEGVTLKNVSVFVSAMGKRILAVANGPAAIISVVAGGCVERSLLNAFDVAPGSAKISGSVASLALGGLLGTGLLATASSDTGSADLALEGWFDGVLESAWSGSADAASSDTASSDTASADAALLDSGSLEASVPVSDALIAGAAGA